MFRTYMIFCAAAIGAVMPTAQAATVSISVGQTAATTRTLANGTPLRVKLVSVGSSEMRYLPFTIDNSKPAVTLTGMLEWLNLMGAIPLNDTGDTPAFNDSTLDPNFSIDDVFGRGNIRSSMRVRSNGTNVSFDNANGYLLTVGGFKHATMDAPFANIAINGGSWKISNIQYSMDTFTATGDLSGTLAALGSTPAQNVPTVTGATLWSFVGPTGPTNLPLASLASSPIANLSTVLQNAGYTSITATASEISFTGVYVMDDLMATSALKNHICASLGCTTFSRSALNASTNNFMGQFRTSIRFSIPLTP